MDIRIHFLSQNVLLNFQKPLVYNNVIGILRENFGDLDNLSILMGVADESDFLVPLENEQDLEEFLQNHQNCESKFELSLNKKEMEISTETFNQDHEVSFIPEPDNIQVINTF
jgi:hypothetical protein